MKYLALIFDFNGVIIDDEALHCRLFQKILAEEEMALTDKDYWDEYLGYDDKGLFKAIYQKNNIKLTPKKLSKLVAQKNQLYLLELKENFELFPGIQDFICQVKDQFILALVSGALYCEIEYVLQKANLSHSFKIIISAEQTKFGKPNPEGYILALAKLKKMNPLIKAENCLVIEDSMAGIAAAKKIKMDVVAMAHTYLPAQLKEADYVAHHVSELFEILQEKKIFNVP